MANQTSLDSGKLYEDETIKVENVGGQRIITIKLEGGIFEIKCNKAFIELWGYAGNNSMAIEPRSGNVIRTGFQAPRTLFIAHVEGENG